MKKGEFVGKVCRTALVFMIVGAVFLGWLGASPVAASDTTGPEVSTPYAIPEGEELRSDFTTLATDIQVIVDEIRDAESGISSVTLAYIWPDTVEMKRVDMYRSPTSSLPDRYVGWIECYEGWPLDNPLPWYYTGIGVLQYAVEATNGAGLSTVEFPLRGMNVDVSTQARSEAQTDARIVRPSIGFPVIRVCDSTFTITVTSEQELPEEESSWSTVIFTDSGIFLPLTVEHVGCDNDYWYSITVRIPSDTPENLYGLSVEVDGQFDYQENAVQVVESFSSQPTFYIVTDPHIGFSGHPKVPEVWEEEPDVDEKRIFENEIEAINRIHPDFVILSGDMVDWSSPDNWEDFENLLKRFEVPVYTLVGNHDYYKDDWWSNLLGGLVYRSRLHALDYYLENINSYLNYNFDYGPFHMVCLDSGHDTELFAAGSGLYDWQINWLESDLDGHPHSFIFMHHPALESYVDAAPTHITRNRLLFQNLCSEKSVCAVFSGHTHRNRYNSHNGVDYYETTSATIGKEENGCRMVRLIGGSQDCSECYETRTLSYTELMGGGSVDVMLIIDSSGSMGSSDPSKERLDAAEAFLTACLPGDQVGVVDFDSTAKLLGAGLYFLPENKDTLSSLIAGIDNSGSDTNMRDAITVSCQELTNDGSAVQRGAILLTDGRHNVGSFGNPQQCFVDNGWPIYTFGFGSADASLLQQIADETGGEYKHISEVSSLLCEFQRVRALITGIEPPPCMVEHIDPSETKTLFVGVPPSQAQATFSSNWIGSDIVMTLVTASGRVIDRGTVAPDVVHDKGADFEVYTIMNPEAGSWQVDLFGLDVPPGGEDVIFGFVSIPVADAGLDPHFFVDKIEVAVGETVTFDPTPTRGGSLPYTRIRCDFDGDGSWDEEHYGSWTPATLPSATWQYDAEGEYHPCLEITDSSAPTPVVRIECMSDPYSINVGDGITKITWNLPYALDADPSAVNIWTYPEDAVTVTLADVETTMPDGLLIWYYGGPVDGWRFYKKGWGAVNTLETLIPGKGYIAIVPSASLWEIPQG